MFTFSSFQSTTKANSSVVAIRDLNSSGAGYGNDIRSLHSAGGGRRPVKVWNAARTIRKALVVATYEEFQRKGREKVGLSPSEPVRVVLEGDGTQVMLFHVYIECEYILSNNLCILYFLI